LHGRSPTNPRTPASAASLPLLPARLAGRNAQSRVIRLIFNDAPSGNAGPFSKLRRTCPAGGSSPLRGKTNPGDGRKRRVIKRGPTVRPSITPRADGHSRAALDFKLIPRGGLKGYSGEELRSVSSELNYSVAASSGSSQRRPASTLLAEDSARGRKALSRDGG